MGRWLASLDEPLVKTEETRLQQNYCKEAAVKLLTSFAFATWNQGCDRAGAVPTHIRLGQIAKACASFRLQKPRTFGTKGAWS